MLPDSRVTSTMTRLRDLFRRRDGSIAVMFALALPVLVGFVALVAEIGQGLLDRAENQRVADLAAFAGALAYHQTGSNAAMSAAADRIASLNGIEPGSVTASLVPSPRSADSDAVVVTIATERPLVLARLVGASASLPVSAKAYAEMGGEGMAACIIALAANQTGVTLSGGTSISAPACAVASNSTVSVPCGTSISTIAVNYNSVTSPSQPCGGITAPAGKSVTTTQTATPDPLDGHAGLATATGRLATVAAMSAPSAPSVPNGTNIDFAWNASATQNAATAIGCTATFASPVWTLTCPHGGTYNFGNVTVGGGITVNFNTGGSSETTYNVKGFINNSGSAMTFGPGTYNIAGGLRTGGGTTTTFAAGTYNIGMYASSCSGANYSICHTGTTLTFGGPSTFVLSSGIYNSGGSTLVMGSGSANSFRIGPGSAGNAFFVGGGSKTTFGDATAPGSVFEIVGNFNMGSGGGSCVQIGAAAHHDIKGFLSAAGGTILGSGLYTVTGHVTFGATGGGNVTCNGESVGVVGSGVSLVIGGATSHSGGSCNGLTFCASAGYSNILLSAPSSGDTETLLVVGPTSNSVTAGATFNAGSGASLSGVFYYPNGPFTMAGGASVANGPAGCLQIIGSRVTMSGGTTAASACLTSGGGSDKVVLVQ